MILGLLSWILNGCFSVGDHELVVIPKDFIGCITIIYNQKTGILPSYQNGKRIFMIPQNGILKTQLAPNPSLKKHTQFFYERVAPENEIPSFRKCQVINAIPKDLQHVVSGFAIKQPITLSHLGNGIKEEAIANIYYVCARKDLHKYIYRTNIKKAVQTNHTTANKPSFL